MFPRPSNDEAMWSEAYDLLPPLKRIRQGDYQRTGSATLTDL